MEKVKKKTKKNSCVELKKAESKKLCVRSLVLDCEGAVSPRAGLVREKVLINVAEKSKLEG